VKVCFAGQTPKSPAFPDAGEDAYALAADDGRVALSDGASESFDSQRWARLLVDRFVRCPAVTAEWVDAAAADFHRQFDRARMSWSQQAAFDRGSFATLLGLEWCASRRELALVGIGDSVAVLVEGDEGVRAFPYGRAEDFERRPQLVCTQVAYNRFLAEPEAANPRHALWRIAEKPRSVVLCMTDALGEWAFRNAQEGHPSWALLAGIGTLAELEALVRDQRLARRLRVDDVTLVVLSFGEGI